MAKAQTMITTGDVWTAAAGCDGEYLADTTDPVYKSSMTGMTNMK